MHRDDITALDACALSAALHRRELSCREVMQAYLARIDALNPKFNALVGLLPHEPLLQQADERDAMLARGHAWAGCTASRWPSRTCRRWPACR